MDNFNTQMVNISEIGIGDTILHVDGFIRTVSRDNIKKGFMGTTLFGDSYKLGTVLVTKINYIKVN